MSDRVRSPGLDGVRGISFLMVFWMHLAFAGAPDLPALPSWVGRQGVVVFFVLSGYLITRRLLEHPGLARFYWRRCWRIFPAFYTYLGVVLGLWAIGWYRLESRAVAAAATYWINWLPGERGWPLSHLWSLAVEEQFYLFWPLLLSWHQRRRLAAEPTLLLILLAWPLQHWWRKGELGPESAVQALTLVSFDSILWGCLAALLSQRGLKAPNSRIPAAILVVLYGWPQVFPGFLASPIRGFCIAWLLWGLTDNPGHRLVRMLEWRGLVWLGQRSYALYLWHMPCCDPRLLPMLGWPTATLATLALAELSYRFIETPGMKRRAALVVRSNHSS